MGPLALESLYVSMGQSATGETRTIQLNSLIQVHLGICVVISINQIFILDSDKDGPPVTKRQKLEQTAQDDVIILSDEETVKSKSDFPAQSSTQTPLFYLTKVRGLNNQYNGQDMAIGIKGNTIA